MTPQTLTSMNPRLLYGEGSWTGEENIKRHPSKKQVWVSEPFGSESCLNPIVSLIPSNASTMFGEISELNTFAQGQLDFETLATSEAIVSWKGLIGLDQVLSDNPTSGNSVWHKIDLLASGAVHLVYSFELAVPKGNSLDVNRRLASLKNLNDGWADGIQPANLSGDGYGKAPSVRGLDWLADALQKRYSDDLSLPHIFPTPEGDVSLEWSIGPYRASLEIDLGTYQAEWHCLNITTDDSFEYDLNLDVPASWEWLTREVRRLEDPKE